MNIINIKTWNVNWFRGKKSGSKYNKNDQSEDSYNHITININTFLNKENSAVILQELFYPLIYNCQLLLIIIIHWHL